MTAAESDLPARRLAVHEARLFASARDEQRAAPAAGRSDRGCGDRAAGAGRLAPPADADVRAFAGRRAQWLPDLAAQPVGRRLRRADAAGGAGRGGDRGAAALGPLPAMRRRRCDGVHAGASGRPLGQWRVGVGRADAWHRQRGGLAGGRNHHCGGGAAGAGRRRDRGRPLAWDVGDRDRVRGRRAGGADDADRGDGGVAGRGGGVGSRPPGRRHRGRPGVARGGAGAPGRPRHLRRPRAALLAPGRRRRPDRRPQARRRAPAGEGRRARRRRAAPDPARLALAHLPRRRRVDGADPGARDRARGARHAARRGARRAGVARD